MSMASCPLVRNSRPGGRPMARELHRVLDLGAGYPLPGADQRMPGMFAHIGQVHGVDAVGDPARAAQVLPLDASRRVALPSPGPVSSSAPITRPRRRRPERRAASSRPATANRRTTPIAAKVSHAGAAEQPLHAR